MPYVFALLHRTPRYGEYSLCWVIKTFWDLTSSTFTSPHQTRTSTILDCQTGGYRILRHVLSIARRTPVIYTCPAYSTALLMIIVAASVWPIAVIVVRGSRGGMCIAVSHLRATFSAAFDASAV